MQFTINDIKEQIPSLSDEQAGAAFDFVKSQVGETTKTIYQNLENDVKEVLGVTKPDGAKTYAFFKDVLSEGKQAAEKLQKAEAKIKATTDQYNDLKGKVEAGKGNEAMDAKVSQLEKELEAAKQTASTLESQLTEKSQEWQSKFEEQAAKAEASRLDGMIDRSLGGVQFKDGLSDRMRELVEADVRSQLHKMEREWVDGKVLYKGENGQVLRHPETAVPFSTEDLVMQTLTDADVIAANRKQGGTGSAKGDPTPANNSTGFLLNGEATQTEAVRNLTTHIKEQGLKPGTMEYQAALDQGFTEVILPAKLPQS